MISCLVNFCVCYEFEINVKLVEIKKCVVVVGVGLVGLVVVVIFVKCGYDVVIYDVFSEIGG